MAAYSVSCSSNVIHVQEYEFLWTIENFSKSPDYLRGPSLYDAVPKNSGIRDFFRENLCIELHFEEKYTNLGCEFKFNVSLIDLNDKDNNHKIVSSCISLINTNGKEYKKEEHSNLEFKSIIKLLNYKYHHSSQYSNKRLLSPQMDLVGDKIVVTGKLSISSDDVTNFKIANEQSSLFAYEELSNDFKYIYEYDAAADVSFSIGEERLRAHKNILSSRSPVFAKMFENDMAESSSNRVIIEDTDFNVFDCFLMYLYTGKVEDKNSETVLSLYALAHKYQVKSLHAVCSGMLRINLATDSVCRALVLSDLHGDKDLNDVAKVFIRHHLSQIAGRIEWAEIVFNKPHLVEKILPTAPSKRFPALQFQKSPKKTKLAE